MNIEEFINNTKNIGIELNDTQIKQFEIYANYLIEYNSHTNLTTITDLKEIYLKHFFDSILLHHDLVDFSNINTVIDVGTGAGFPGMVLKIVYPDLNVTLLDSNNKKTKFLEELAIKLNVENIKVINKRSEDFAKENLDSYDLVVSRAVANLRVLSEICLPLVKENGLFVALKGNIEEEFKIAQDIIPKLNGKLETIYEYNLPVENAERNLVIIRKIGKNPKGYPRNYNIIKKEYERLK